MSTSCIVTGGTGFAGLNFVIEVLENDLFGKMYCLVRENSSRLRFLNGIIQEYKGKSKTDVEIIFGDLLDGESLEKVYPNDLDAMFHIAAHIDVKNQYIEEQNRTNIEGTRILCDLALERKTKRFIHISSISVYGTSMDKLDQVLHIDEEKPKRGQFDAVNYARSKYYSEVEVLKFVEEKGLDAVILQPGFLMGENDYTNTTWNKFVKLVKDGEFNMTGLPDGVICLTDVKSLARVMYSAYEYGKSGESYVIGGVNVGWKGMADVVSHYFHLDELPLASYKLLWAVGLGYEMIYGVRNLLCCCVNCCRNYNTIRRVPDITRNTVRSFLFSKLKVDSSKSVKELGYEIVDVEEIIIRTCRWIEDLEKLEEEKKED